MVESLYLGLYWNSTQKIWIASGTVNGKLMRFASGTCQHTLARETRGICKALKKKGQNVRNEYGILKTQKKSGFQHLPYIGLCKQKSGGFVGYGFVNNVRTYLGCGRDMEKCASEMRKRVAKFKQMGCVVREAYGELRSIIID